MNNLANMLESSRQQVNIALEYYLHNITSQQTLLVQAMRHSTLLGGKRLRPFLVYQTGQLFGIKPISLNAPASAIECMHAYSLIHDDLPIMDNDTLRRGIPTCHTKFGETIAILAGDALQTLAFSILADAEMPEVNAHDRLQMISTLAAASGADGMCLGQALDLTVNDKDKRASSSYLEMIYQYKTGSLIRAAVKIGVLAAGIRGKPVLEHLDRFATAIGLAFQVQDDILDIVGNSQTTGKHQRVDKKLGKNTYPNILGLDSAREKIKDLYHESLASLEYVAALGYDTSTLVELARFITERDQ